MNIKKLLLYLLLIFSTTSGCGQTVSHPPLQGMPAKLDSVFTKLAESGKFNGNVLIAEKGKPIYTKSFGKADEASGAMLNDSSVFELASVSKQFTAAAIMLLKKQNKLSLDDTLGKFLPQLGFYGKVSVRQLLHHTGGLPDYMEAVAMEFIPTDGSATNDDIVRIFAMEKPAIVFAPGEKFEYSNTGYALLSSIISKASGMSYADYLDKYIFKPLGMRNSFVYTRRYAPRKVANYAYGYVYVDKEYVLPDDNENFKYVVALDGITGDGTVNATTTDLLKWDRALTSDKLFSKAERDEIFSPGKLNSGKFTKYGYGWSTDSTKSAGRIVSHTGGWPGYKTLIERNLDRDYTVIILSNHENSVLPLAPVRKIMLNEQTVVRTEIVMPVEKLKTYVGDYALSDKVTMKIFLEGERLKTQLTGQQSLFIYPEADKKFFLKSPEAQLQFSANPAGEIVRVTLFQNGNEINAEKIK